MEIAQRIEWKGELVRLCVCFPLQMIHLKKH
jgi:hypothetical protein